ncbi:type II secretion system F family protein [Planctomycetota bacterium]
MPPFEYDKLNQAAEMPTITVEPTSTPEPEGIEQSMQTPPQEIPTPHSQDSLADNKDDLIELSHRIKISNLCVTTRQLAILLRAGLPLVPALAALTEQLEGQPLAPVMQQVHNRVNNGAALADALQKYHPVFSHLYINMVRAGEAGGALPEVLIQLAQMLQKRHQLIGKVKSALAYPLLMAVVAVGVVAFLLTFVIPSLADIFLDMDRNLPAPTALLINISMFLKTHLIALSIAGCLLVAAVGAYLKSQTGRLKWDHAKLKLPLFGNLLLKVEATRFARTLGVMLASGISILDALVIVKGVMQNRYIAAQIDTVRQDIARGRSIAETIKNTHLFPPIMHHAIAVGEMSGGVEEQLINFADAYDEEIETITRSLTALLEPAILLVMGAIVGFIVLALLLPIFEINQML